jgi:hypothetical protein
MPLKRIASDAFDATTIELMTNVESYIAELDTVMG